jgi:hypothetical protein
MKWGNTTAPFEDLADRTICLRAAAYDFNGTFLNVYDLIMSIPPVCFLIYLAFKTPLMCKLKRLLSIRELQLLSTSIGMCAVTLVL